MNDAGDGSSEGSAEGFKTGLVHDIDRMIGRVIPSLRNGIQGEVNVSTSSETLPCPIPFHHGHLAVFACFDQSLSQGVLFIGELSIVPVNPRCR